MFSSLSSEEKEEIDLSSKGKVISTAIYQKYLSICKKIQEPSFPYKGRLKTIFVPSLMRGQGIYKGKVFEGYVKGSRSSIFAGGEYKIGEYYCTGLSIGVDAAIEE